MKRLLKNGIYLIIIAAILFMASRVYEGSSASTQDKFKEIHEIAITGDSPQGKVDHLAYIMEQRHENVSSIVGEYVNLTPLNKTNYVHYRIHLRFELSRRATSFISSDIVEEKRTQILGELAIATAELLSAETHMQYIGENILHEMIIFAETVYYDPKTFERYDEQKVYLFENNHIKNLISGKTEVKDWSKYQVPLEFYYSLPNTGPAEKQQPPPPK